MIGQTIAHYKVLEKLGAGGMGIVYKAHDTRLDRDVALKFLPPHLTSDPEAKERFIHEAKAASALQHPNICVVHDFDETADGQIFIVMEFLQGETLKEKIEGALVGGGWKVENAVDVALQVAQGLAKAHEHGIVHRDIKPANIIITSDGVPKIVDFGLAKLGGGSMVTRTGSTLGTVAYMSPEQARGETADAQADIWALGVVLFEMVTGKLPFRGEHDSSLIYSIINEDPQSIRTLRPDIPAPVETVVVKCMEKNTTERFGSMGEVVRALREVKREIYDSSGTAFLKKGTPIWKRPGVIVPVILLLLGLAYGIYWFVDRSDRISWARGEGVTEVARLADQGRYFEAFLLATQIETLAPEDPLLLKTWPRFSRHASIQTEPPGAGVYMKDYFATDDNWTFLGTSPLDSMRLPVGFLLLKFRRDGFAELHAAALTRWVSSITYLLDSTGSLPDGMVHVPGGSFSLDLSGLEHVDSIKLGDYLIDQYEVTNKEYKRFVDAGGYQQRHFWKHAFVKNGKSSSWEAAMREFKDKTGRFGPSTWEVGSYPQGQADLPVAGVSWYEAAAYADYVGKSLPTIFHWNRAAVPLASSYIVPMSNFRDEGLDPPGKNQGLGAFGTYDMAGNVREWCWNGSGNERFILGGGWNDQTYMFTDAYTQPSFDRSPTNGFRCVRYLNAEANLGLAMKPITRPFRNFLKEKPVPDAVFGFYLPLFAYDRTDLRSTVESSDTTEEWVKQKITFNAAYGNERVTAFLFLPRVGNPPYQTVVYFPGSNAILDRSSVNLQMGVIDFVITSGRAVLYPIYKGTYERNSGITTDQPSMTNAYKDWIIQLGKDLGRSVDYLETRIDIDKDRLAFYGLSWGGRLGVLFMAVEKRFKTSVLYVAGLKFQRALPEADPVNYASRVKMPVLMLNGRYDNFFPLETSQVPLYRMLGTPEPDKRHVVYESGHFVPRIQLIKEVLDWLDHYLGAVQSMR